MELYQHKGGGRGTGDCALSLDFGLTLAARITDATRPLLGKSSASQRIQLGNHQKMRLDVEAARTLRSALEESGIACHLISEEWGRLSLGKNPTSYLIVDEFDGTVNGARGIPFSAISIAISETPRLKDVHTGIVVDIFRNITYHAVKGKGAYRNGRRIRTSQRKSFEDCIISIKTSASSRETIDHLRNLLPSISHGRDLGAAALELSYLASGQLDAMIDLRGKSRATDIAAGFLLVSEAGGRLLTLNDAFKDSLLDANGGVPFVAASGPGVMNQILRILRI